MLGELMELNDDTKQQIAEGEKATRLLENEDWRWAREKLEGFITALDSISTLQDGTNEVVGEEAKVRKKAQIMVLSWIQEIESLSQQTKSFNESLWNNSPPKIINH